MKPLFTPCTCLALFLLLGLPAGAARAQTPNINAATSYVENNAEALGLTADDVRSYRISDAYVSRHTGVSHVYLTQQYQGIDVHNALINVNVQRDGTIFGVGNRFIAKLREKIAGSTVGLPAVGAAEAAAAHLGLTTTEPLTVLETTPGPHQETLLNNAGISLENIPARLVYQPLENGEVRLAWDVSIYMLDAQHWWNVRIDAGTGAVLEQYDLVIQDVWGEPLYNATDYPGEAPSNALVGSYRVFAQPLESPNHGMRTLEANPDDPTASPFGWHDTNGSPGAEFTRTQGNNAHAYTDIDANNSPDVGSDPDGGPGLVFDFPLDLNMGPETYRPAAVTNLFYWNNIVHDIVYQYGFDEASGNFQENNYGKGGLGSDYVQAEAQDGSGTNNANFATPADGSNPRMQMFRWTSPFPNELVVGAPVNDTYAMSGANFGPSFDGTGVTGDLVLVDDGTGTKTDGCEPLINGPDVSGNIALIDRGTCSFVTKIRNAQTVGATAVVIINNVAGSPITLGDDGTGGDIVIPGGMISQNDGNTIKAAPPGVTGTARSAGGAAVDRDSDLDNGIITHEYAHGISNRLTGGPGNIFCLSTEEQMGEGWSDWYALMLTQRGSDTATQGRGVGTYVRYEPTTGLGIRPRPYSTDFAVNEFTYDNIKTASVPHGVGHVWSTMLWDLNWALIGDFLPECGGGDDGSGGGSGFDSDLYGGNGGNNLALQLVTDGMKLQGCSPGFVDGRDAILAADMALTGGLNENIIWRVFARRGLGFSASQGSSNSAGDGTEAFDLPPGLPACGGTPPPSFTIRFRNNNPFFINSKGVQKAVVRWNIAEVSTNKIDIYVTEEPAQPMPDGTPNKRTKNDSKHKQKVPLGNGGPLYNIQACEKNSTTVCSNVIQADFTNAIFSDEPDDDDEAGKGAAEVPEEFALRGNYPNPFNPSTQIQFDLPSPAEVTVEVVDVLGRVVLRVPSQRVAAGFSRRVEVDGSVLASGTYVYRLTARMEEAVEVSTGRMVLVK